MHISDGEYDIDLLVLAYDTGSDSSRSTQNGPLALRYGFVPDSMSQTAPLKLYRDEKTCVLEAQLTNKLSKSGKPPSVIFEGIQQRQRPSNGTGPGPDSYFLAFVPKSSGKFEVLLQNLANTIRMSKSRNADKWRAAIAGWESADGGIELEIPKIEPKVELKLSTSSPQQQQAVATTRPKARAASKRPPTATPETKDIINMSDFEDLESDSGKPDLISGSVVSAPAKTKTQPKSETDLSQPRKRASKRPGPEAANKKPKTTKSKKTARAKETEEADISDDFKDLEDQLQEVLESTASEGLPAGFGNVDSESDEDDDMNGGNRQRIVINMANEEPTTKKRVSGKAVPSTEAPKGKPKSLRELYGGSRGDDFSSSEEE